MCEGEAISRVHSRRPYASDLRAYGASGARRVPSGVQVARVAAVRRALGDSVARPPAYHTPPGYASAAHRASLTAYESRRDLLRQGAIWRCGVRLVCSRKCSLPL